MTRTILSYCSILLMGVVTASADQLNFNDLQIGEEVLGYYDGGLGSLGTGPGPNLGITFTADFVTVEQGVFGPPFQAEELTSTSGIMDVVPGIGGPFSFYYSNSGPDGTVNLYSGLDGSGSLVGTIALPPSPGFTATGDIEPLFNSAIFSATPGALVFDNITFCPPGSGLCGLVIPESSSISLLLIGLLAVWLADQRRHHRSIARSGR
jgi:hypothetical protein